MFTDPQRVSASPLRRPAPRSRFHRSPLVRCLEGPGLAALPPDGPTVAQRLGDWLDWRDALGLFDTLEAADQARASSGAGVPAATHREPRSDADAHNARHLSGWREQLARLRGEFARDIAADSAFRGALRTPDEVAQARSRHAAWQSSMETRIASERERLRAAMSAAAPALAPLAALDALMARALALRERQLLAKVPSLLAQAAPRSVDPVHQLPPGNGAAWQHSLLAELDLRLQPLDGLLEAWAAAARPVPTQTMAST